MLSLWSKTSSVTQQTIIHKHSSVAEGLQCDVDGAYPVSDTPGSEAGANAPSSPAPQMPASQVVELNVGGHLFTTTRTTLCKYGDTMLASRFAGDMTPAYVDSRGRYFIDRDGTHFGTILAYLREQAIQIPSDAKELAALATEASFYQVCDFFSLDEQNLSFMNKERCRFCI